MVIGLKLDTMKKREYWLLIYPVFPLYIILDQLPLLLIYSTLSPLFNFIIDVYEVDPGTNYSVIRSFQKGTKVEFISKENDWVKVNYNGTVVSYLLLPYK